MKCYVPSNLDVDELIIKHPPKFERFNKDKLIAIVSVIATARKKEDGFAEIYSKNLQELAHDYINYLNYFEENGVIIIDNQFYYNELFSKCRGYKFSDNYNTTIGPVEINYLPLVKKEIKKSQIPDTVKRDCGHLTKWFNSNLTVDFDAAVDYASLEKSINMPIYKRKLKELQSIESTWYPNYADKIKAIKKIKIKDPIARYNKSYYWLDRLNDGYYHVKVSKKVHRFTSVLTQIQSDYRAFIRYDGKTLTSVDIKNCLPYLSLILLDVEFWEGYKTNQYFLFNTSCLLHLSPSSTILVKSLESIDNQEIKLYKRLVLSGEIYDFIAKHLESKKCIEFESRKELKKIIFQALFSGNQFIGQPEAIAKRIFKEHFPGIYNFFSLLKKDQKEFFPRLLLRIESHLVLNVITKRISKEFPSLPIFTIHDNIVSLSGWEDYIRDVISEELTKIVGFTPSTRIEPWNEQNLKYYKAWKAKNK